MIILSISSVRSFTSHLFVKESFDSWLVSEVTLGMGNTFRISGHLNKSFYSDEEWNSLNNTDYTSWKSLRPVCFEIIKGNKSPAFMKLILQLPDDTCSELICRAGSAFAPEDVNALFINIRYEHGSLTLTTGSSMKTFTMDHSLDELFENYVKAFLSSLDIEYD